MEVMRTGVKKVILIIADISGYTNYMLSNVQSLEHGQQVITELLKAVIKQADMPLEVAKLEGDAVFLYAIMESGKEVAGIISDRLLKFFHAFQSRLDELAMTDCECGACVNVVKLRLKLIVHSGEALFYEIGNFLELAGVDVIIAHRLLKNSVPSNEYILLTEAAVREIQIKEKIRSVEGVEKYDAIGEIKTRVYYPAFR